jgi:hypothetical protein
MLVKDHLCLVTIPSNTGISDLMFFLLLDQKKEPKKNQDCRKIHRKTALRSLHVLNSVAEENILEVFCSFKQ